jgi:hypothetical protein
MKTSFFFLFASIFAFSLSPNNSYSQISSVSSTNSNYKKVVDYKDKNFLLSVNQIPKNNSTLSSNANISTSVIVPVTESFKIVPNPVKGEFIDIHLPADINGFNPNTRFRITRFDGVLILDTEYINLLDDDNTVQKFQSLNNGNYIAQVYNVSMGINRIFLFVIAK